MPAQGPQLGSHPCVTRDETKTSPVNWSVRQLAGIHGGPPLSLNASQSYSRLKMSRSPSGDHAGA